MSEFVKLKNKGQAKKLSDDVDAYCNLPWSGIEHDTGRIVPNQTTKMAQVREKSDKKEYAYQDQIGIRENGKPDKVEVPADATFADVLGPEWDDSVPVTARKQDVLASGV